MISVKDFSKLSLKSYYSPDSIGHLFRNVRIYIYQLNWIEEYHQLDWVEKYHKLIYYEIILENKKTYILHHLMYKVHIKGLENIGFL